jgi:hypothetical protein
MITASVDLSDTPFTVYLSRGRSVDPFVRENGKTYSRALEVEAAGKLSPGGSRRERQVAREALHAAGVAGF